ncbi:hypothetical protein [Saccharothrix xinjiangensis]|uniref:Uncharacterized protein n=1 Tax=Saccharothrix xinjiangensis TaxID=204798 RepID=A0ABV9XUU2_9PSEU
MKHHPPESRPRRSCFTGVRGKVGTRNRVEVVTRAFRAHVVAG